MKAGAFERAQSQQHANSLYMSYTVCVGLVFRRYRHTRALFDEIFSDFQVTNIPGEVIIVRGCMSGESRARL